MTLAPLRVSEAADSLVKASTPQPFSTSKTSNWVARAGGLPDYIQHVAHGILRSAPGDESGAIAKAIGVVKRWAAGGGGVDANTKAAAAKAVAEWEAKKAGAHAGVKESYVATLAAEQLARDSALLELAMYERVIGLDGMVGLLAEGALAESAAWSPTFKRTASAPRELERHEVYDGGQHCGTLTRRKGFEGKPDRYSAYAVNGQEVTDYNTTSKPDALKALQTHLGEAPARVIAWPTAGKFMVAQPSSYSGDTSYKSFPSEAAARHAAGLPASPTVPERNSKVTALAEAVRFDLLTVAHLDIPPLATLQEAAHADPLALLEEFNPGELRGFGGKWIAGAGSLRRDLTPRMLPGRSTPKRGGPDRSSAAQRYEGGVTRETAKLRAAHAAKPQIALATDKRPEAKLAAAVKSGSWDKSANAASAKLIAQPQMGMHEIEAGVKGGTAADTEAIHRTGPGGTYSKERQALHEHIIDLLLQGKGVHEGKAKAIFTAGGGASGKSAMVASGAVKVPHDAVIVNPDVVREMLPEYKALKAAGREDAASLTHEEASHISKVVTRLALGRQHHLLVDGVGDSGKGKFAGKIKDAISAGHETSVHYATVPTAEALRRSDLRGAETGRYVDHAVLRSAHKAVSAHFPDVAKIKGAHVQVFDTGRGTKEKPQPPALMADKPRGSDKLGIKDRPGFGGFLDKANE